jgi:ribonucleoside-diphosphate reductase alpha chain
MSGRHRLANRRKHEVAEFECDGVRFIAGIGRSVDGQIAELFLNAGKPGCAAETAARDAAIILSIALQHGCPLDTIQHALTKLADGKSPAGPIGRALEIFEG